MGLTFTNAAFLVQARLRGTSFQQMVTLGHQQQYLSAQHLLQLSRLRGLSHVPTSVLDQYYSDHFFRTYLDSELVDSLDYSAYEGCDIVHDMNTPLDKSLYCTRDAVVDGGSLEHIFNFPVAIANCMNLVKEGGSLFIFTACNNLSGHGFYQFSPELFYRVLHPSNGFRIQQIVLEAHQYPSVQLSSHTKCFSVVDPEKVGQRVQLVNRTPTTIMVHAVKVRAKDPFAEPPIQSDYAQQYAVHDQTQCERSTDVPVKNRESWKKRLVMNLPDRWRNLIIGKRELWKHSFANKQFYRQWNPLEPPAGSATTTAE